MKQVTMTHHEYAKVKQGIKKTKKQNELCSKQFDLVYDCIAVLISLADIITDIWVLIEWYYKDRMLFFWISLTILILANLSYIIVFIIRYDDTRSCMVICCLTFLFLPFAPFLSFVFCCLHNNDMGRCCSQYLNFAEYRKQDNESKSREWMEIKLSKHVGFVMEAIMESFPQSILQMIAIMYFNELNIISILSILISMLSVSSKSLIFSAATSINHKTMLFTWIYVVADFFSIFFFLSFVFYTGDNINVNSINTLRDIWLYKLYMLTIPVVFFFSLPLFGWGFGQLSYQIEDIPGTRLCRCNYVVAFILVLPMWAFGMILGTMILEILCYVYIAYIIYKLGHGRVPSTASSITWIKIINWIEHESISFDLRARENTHIVKKQDAIIRICCVNRQLLLMKNTDISLYKFLEKKEHDGQYRDVSYKTIKKLYKTWLLWDNFYAIFLKSFWKRHYFINLMFLYYFLGRITNIIFPFLVITVIVVNGESIIYDLPLFQMIMLFIMLWLILIMLVTVCVIYNEERIIFYILPNPVINRLYAGIDDYLFTMIVGYYERLITKPIINQLLCEHFGSDLGVLIFSFIPFEIEEEEHAKKLTQNAEKYTAIHRSTLKRTIGIALFRTPYVLGYN